MTNYYWVHTRHRGRSTRTFDTMKVQNVITNNTSAGLLQIGKLSDDIIRVSSRSPIPNSSSSSADKKTHAKRTIYHILYDISTYSKQIYWLPHFNHQQHLCQKTRVFLPDVVAFQKVCSPLRPAFVFLKCAENTYVYQWRIRRF